MSEFTGCPATDLQDVTYDKKLKDLLNGIFTDEFMRKYTNFENFFDFQSSSAVIVNWNSDNLIFSTALMDSFVRESTTFGSWNEMVIMGTDLKFGEI